MKISGQKQDFWLIYLLFWAPKKSRGISPICQWESRTLPHHCLLISYNPSPPPLPMIFSKWSRPTSRHQSSFPNPPPPPPLSGRFFSWLTLKNKTNIFSGGGGIYLGNYSICGGAVQEGGGWGGSRRGGGGGGGLSDWRFTVKCLIHPFNSSDPPPPPPPTPFLFKI